MLHVSRGLRIADLQITINVTIAIASRAPVNQKSDDEVPYQGDARAMRIVKQICSCAAA
jgi:hypothetical protein